MSSFGGERSRLWWGRDYICQPHFLLMESGEADVEWTRSYNEFLAGGLSPGSWAMTLLTPQASSTFHSSRHWDLNLVLSTSSVLTFLCTKGYFPLLGNFPSGFCYLVTPLKYAETLSHLTKSKKENIDFKRYLICRGKQCILNTEHIKNS